MSGGAGLRWPRGSMFPTFSAPQPEGTPKSDAAKGQKISSGEVLALGGGALAGCAVVFTVVGIHSLGVGTRYTAAPDSCHDPPLECWDGFSRANSGTMCPVMNQDTFIRGELFKAGERTCYKAVYWNADKATLVMFAWLVVWIALVIKALDRVVSTSVAKSCRWAAFVAVATAQPSLWYSFVTLIEYHNDFTFNFYSSQLFFTLTETFLFVTMVVLLDKKTLISAPVWYAAAGTSAYHIFQLLMDEGSSALRGIGVGSTAHMLLADITSSVVLWSIGRSCNNKPEVSKAVIRVALVLLAEWLTFNLVFGDASSGWSQQIRMGRGLAWLV